MRKCIMLANIFYLLRSQIKGVRYINRPDRNLIYLRNKVREIHEKPFQPKLKRVSKAGLTNSYRDIRRFD